MKRRKLPVGTVLACNLGVKPGPKDVKLGGQLLSKEQYPELYKIIGDVWGPQDKKRTKFRVPQLGPRCYLRAKS